MSEVKVNKITPRTDCGTTQLGDSGDTVTVTGDLRSDSLKAADGGVIISQSGTTITVGASGDTVSLASGASQSGFGRSGSVDWQTGSLKTSTFTASSGEGYFINQGSAITMNLPAGTAGSIVAVSDYARNFSTYNLTIAPNGSQKIGGTADDLKLNVDGQALTLVYVDDTKGWINVQNAEDTEVGGSFIEATGGTISDCGTFRTHIFSGPGTFAVSALAGTPANNAVDYLVVAGGAGAGSRQHGSGGGAGGFRVSNSLSLPAPTMSPLSNPTGLTATVASFPITVGGGGAGGTAPAGANNPGVAGSPSTFSTITSAGGGGGGAYNATGSNGGSGGGGGGIGNSGAATGGRTGGAGNTPPVSPPQGNAGGTGSAVSPCGQGGGGGGAAATGGNGGNPSSLGLGGIGSFVSETFIGTPQSGNFGTTGPVSSTRYFAGGGAGAVQGGGSPKAAASGGGGAGTGSSCTGGAATANTGGGGGGAGGSGGDNVGGAGGSGVVMIRYKFQA